MTDIMTPEQRSRCMRHIHGRNTKPEIIVRKFLFAAGLRFRVNVRCLPGTPDLVLRKYKTVIFINGCFWHGHTDCSLFRLPKTNTLFWKNKIEHNRIRDQKVKLQLRNLGWNVITIWECQLKPAQRRTTLESLLYTLNHIYLKNHSLRPYKSEEPTHAIAAEAETDYLIQKSNNMNPHYHVVAAIIQHEGKILCMQRGQTRFPYTSFKYEFPGGKIETGETAQQALQREIREEMDYQIEVGQHFITVNQDYPDFSITMQAFLCTATSAHFTMREHHDFKWLTPDHLEELDWAAADLPIAIQLSQSAAGHIE